MNINIITNCTLAPTPVVNEISSPTTHTDTDDYSIFHYILLFIW